MILTAKEEILVDLYRALDPAQRDKLIQSMRALVDANRITQAKLKKPIKIVGDVRVEAKYGMPTPRTSKRSGPDLNTKPKPRRPDRAQDDNE